MCNPYTNSKLSIKYFFWMLILLTFTVAILRAIIPFPSEDLKTIIFDAYIAPMVFYIWSFYWLSNGLKSDFAPSLAQALQKPFKKGWTLETLATFFMSLVFSFSTLMIFYALMPPSVPVRMTDLELLKASSYSGFVRLSIFLNCISIAFVTPLFEELIFREVFFKRLKARFSPLKSAVLVSIGFSILHANPFGAFTFSLVACLLCQKYHSLWPSIVLGILTNTMVTAPPLLNIFEEPSTLILRLEPESIIYLLSLLLISTIALSVYFYKNKPHYSNKSL